MPNNNIYKQRQARLWDETDETLIIEKTTDETLIIEKNITYRFHAYSKLIKKNLIESTVNSFFSFRIQKEGRKCNTHNYKCT